MWPLHNTVINISLHPVNMNSYFVNQRKNFLHWFQPSVSHSLPNPTWSSSEFPWIPDQVMFSFFSAFSLFSSIPNHPLSPLLLSLLLCHLPPHSSSFSSSLIYFFFPLGQAIIQEFRLVPNSWQPPRLSVSSAEITSGNHKLVQRGLGFLMYLLSLCLMHVFPWSAVGHWSKFPLEPCAMYTWTEDEGGWKVCL